MQSPQEKTLAFARLTGFGLPNPYTTEGMLYYLKEGLIDIKDIGPDEIKIAKEAGVIVTRGGVDLVLIDKK